MQILVRNFEGVTTCVEVESTQITVWNLRAKLLEKQGFFLQSSNGGEELDVCFRVGAKIIDDDLITLAAFNIHQGSTIEVIMRVRGGAGHFIRPKNQKRSGGVGYQRSSSSNNNHHSQQATQPNKEKKVSEMMMEVYVRCPVTDHGTSLTVERNNVTVDDIKLLVLRDQGVDIPKEETVLSWNESILRDGNKKLRDYKIKHKFWNRLLLEWKDPEGGATDDDEEEW